jgi:hypothetical protein
MLEPKEQRTVPQDGSETITDYSAPPRPITAPTTLMDRPMSVVVVAALYLLIGCGPLLTFAFLAFLQALPYLLDPSKEQGCSICTGSFSMMVAVASLIPAIPFVVAAVGVWWLRRWGVKFAFLSSILFLLGGVPALYWIVTSPVSNGFLIWGLVSLAWVLAGLVTLFFLLKRAFRARFR